MKKFVLLLAFTFGSLSLSAQTYSTNADATLDVSNIMGSDELLNVRYFYYPNLQAYYDRETSTYLYTRNGKDWIESGNLPNGLRGYSLNNGKRVPLTDYNGDEPYAEIEKHREQFPPKYDGKREKKSEDELTQKKSDRIATTSLASNN